MDHDSGKSRRFLILLVLEICILFAGPLAYCQTVVSLHLRQPPPHQLRLTDLWEVDILNPGAPIANVQLVAVLRNGANAIVLTAATSPFTLPTGVKVVTAATSASLGPVQLQYTSPGYRDIVIRTSQFPAGAYTLCVTARTAVATRVADLATDCIDQSVAPEIPPMLIVPADESTVTEPYPVFTWTWGGASQPDTRITYTMRLVEILGKQSTDAALQGNLAWFEQDGLRSTILQYPPAARPLQAGQRYAWMVTAFTYDQPAGRSEVWEFTYQPPVTKPYSMVTAAPQTEVHLDVLQELLKSCSGTP